MHKTKPRNFVPPIFICAALLIIPRLASAEILFTNLGFESAKIVPIPDDVYGRVQFDQAVPGWTAYIGSEPQTMILYNNMYLSSSGFALMKTNGYVYDGKYAMVLQTGLRTGQQNVSLSQTGLIPAGTQSLQFKSSGERYASFDVGINGQALPLVILQTFAGYDLYAADISQFAGQTVELKFNEYMVIGYPGELSLDSIIFSPVAVPEPASIALFGLGGIGLFLAARRRDS
ncbi:MAG: PEP-CTERM sorting domain-containing protein [Verrucomicrobiota bacterium]